MGVISVDNVAGCFKLWQLWGRGMGRESNSRRAIKSILSAFNQLFLEDCVLIERIIFDH